MKHSNIFAYVELSKLAESLTLDPDKCRTELLSQHAYFKIIPSRMFSDELAPEWDDLCNTVTRSGTAYDDKGKVMMNAVKNTIRQMSKVECREIAERIVLLKQKVDEEF